MTSLMLAVTILLTQVAPLPGTDAGAPTTLQTAMAESNGLYINVKDRAYGAAGNGTANDTAAIQSAINAACAAGGGGIFFPRGDYKVTVTGGGQALSLQCSNVTLLAVKGTARIRNASATGDTLQIGTERVTTAKDCKIDGLVFEPIVKRTSGSEIFAPDFHNLTFRDMKLKGMYRGFYLGSPAGAVKVHMTDVWMDDFYQSMFLVRVIQGEFYSVFADGQRNDTVNLHIDGYNEGLNFHGCIFISNAPPPKTKSYMLEIDNDVVKRPSQFVYFNSCYFDFGNYGVVAQNAYSYTFTDCWFKGQSADGVLLDATAHEFTFQGCDFFNSGANGLYINGSTGHVITGNRFINNGTVIADSAGIRVGSPAGHASDGIVITSNRIGPSRGSRISDAGIGSQNYGVVIDPGALSFIVKDNDCRGNARGAVNNLAGTSGVKIVADNLF